MTAPVFAIDGVIRDYAWGSRTAIQSLLGIEPDGRPAAELWFGAHPADPSPAPAPGATLDELIAAEPDRLLGADVVARSGPRLPFLLKVLAADKALSIQVHPNARQAAEGYAAEERAGLPVDAAQRNYKDPCHKPELLCALTPFEALCGFRPVAATLELLAGLGAPELDFLADLLRGPDGLRAAFTALLRHERPAELADAVARRAAPEGPLRAAHLAAQDAPGDIGVVVAVLLNHVRLEPGEAIFLGAGNVHAYLRGTGIEIMANSDNVLRCGLTPKHVDVPELLRITDFAPLEQPRWPASGGRFDVPVPDFALAVEPAAVTAVLAGGTGPRIVLCTSGSVGVGVGVGAGALDGVRLGAGRAAFVSAGVAARLSGSGQVFVATTG